MLPLPDDEPDGRSLRTAIEIHHARLVAEARRRALLWGLGALAAAAFWVIAGDASVDSLALPVLGVALFFVWTSFARWRRLATTPPLDPRSPEAIAARAELEAAVERHTALVSTRRPYATWALLVLLAAVYLLEARWPDEGWVDRAGLVKPLAREGQWWRMLSATYLHAGLLHIWMNGISLRNVGTVMEAYAPRMRLPLVYLLSALGGSLASVAFMREGASVGASGAILGVLGYLIVLARRRPAEIFPGMRSALVTSALLTACLGIFGFAFIDNAAHAGGFATGALVGLASIPRGSEPPSRGWDAAGVVAAVLLVFGAVFTALVLWG